MKLQFSKPRLTKNKNAENSGAQMFEERNV
jgi:hypothetical protein